MFGIGSTELLVILVVALIVLGPKSLASVSRSLGRAIGEFRRVSTDFQRSLNVETAREEVREAEARRAAGGMESQTAAPGPGAAEMAGPPPDSPLGQAIARARVQAEKNSGANAVTATTVDASEARDATIPQRGQSHG